MRSAHGVRSDLCTLSPSESSSSELSLRTVTRFQLALTELSYFSSMRPCFASYRLLGYQAVSRHPFSHRMHRQLWISNFDPVNSRKHLELVGCGLFLNGLLQALAAGRQHGLQWGSSLSRCLLVRLTSVLPLQLPPGLVKFPQVFRRWYFRSNPYETSNLLLRLLLQKLETNKISALHSSKITTPI